MRLLALLLLFACSIPAYSADLFGNEEETLPGELPLGEQKELYDQFFGAFDKSASNSTKKLKLAQQLQNTCEDEKYKPMRRYILKRIQDLTNDSKKYQGYALQVFAYTELNKHKDADHTSNKKLIELLSKQLSKAPKDEREAITGEIATLYNQNAKFALTEKNYDLASEDYKALAGYLAKTKDKDGAAMAKKMISHIKHYQKEKKKIVSLKEKADADSNDIKSNAAVGRFYVRESDWKTAHPYLVKGQEDVLVEIAGIAALEKPDYNQQGQCAVAIGKALMDRNNKKDTALRRAILELGVAIKSVLEKHEDDLSPALKIKYALVSEEWNAELEKIGPNPLAGFEVAGSGASVDEARLVRMGWEPLFDHKTTSNVRSDHDKNLASATCKNGILELSVKPGGQCIASLWPNLPKYKSIKVRFKFTSERSYGWITLLKGSWNEDLARICIRGENANLSKQYGFEFGSQKLLREWNDLTFTLRANKEIVVTLNGKEYDKPVPYPHEQFTGFSCIPGGIRADLTMQIQSVLGLPHDK